MEIDNLSIVVCILARDCAKRLKRNIPRIERICSAARESHVIVVENDSVDNTKKILSDWAQRNESVIVVCKDHNAAAGNGSRGTDRISRMASYRNAYMETICQHNLTPDLVIMIDVDACHISVKGLITAVENAPEDFAGLFANGTRRVMKLFLPYYYDLYAYVPWWGNAGHSLAQMRKNGRELQQQLRKSPYVECRSAFGGIGVYRYEAIKDNRYFVAVNSARRDEVLCEHITFNADARGKLYVARKMKFNYGRRTLRGLLWQTFATDKMFERKPKFI